MPGVAYCASFMHVLSLCFSCVYFHVIYMYVFLPKRVGSKSSAFKDTIRRQRERQTIKSTPLKSEKKNLKNEMLRNEMKDKEKNEIELI
jgi:hypothetical protein